MFLYADVRMYAKVYTCYVLWICMGCFAGGGGGWRRRRFFMGEGGGLLCAWEDGVGWLAICAIYLWLSSNTIESGTDVYVCVSEWRV